MKTIYIIIGITIIILLSLDIWRRMDPPVSKFDETPYRDSISNLHITINQKDSINQDLKNQNYTLQSLKQQTKIIYREKILYLTGLSTSELDSCLLSGIK